MSAHRHLSSDDICERTLEGRDLPEIAGCAQCESEAFSFRQVFAGLKRADAETALTTEWDDLLLRGRIREAIAREKPRAPSLFDRFLIFRPVFAAAVIAVLAIVAWSPLSHFGEAERSNVASISPVSHLRIPAWTPLPDEADDEGLAVLAAWTPNEDELAVAHCRSACLSGLTNHEEDTLILAASNSPALIAPLPGVSPL